MEEDERHPPLALLDALVGAWEMHAPEFPDPTGKLRAEVTFEWMKGEHFLIQRWDISDPTFPSGIAIIGYDEAAERFTQHYFDSRGIARVYQMTLNDGVWQLWRDDPDFAQRFTGTFSDDGAAITGRWEIAHDRVHWEHDFNLIYSRIA
jgi:hypothetical protein